MCSCPSLQDSQSPSLLSSLSLTASTHPPRSTPSRSPSHYTSRSSRQTLRHYCTPSCSSPLPPPLHWHSPLSRYPLPADSPNSLHYYPLYTSPLTHLHLSAPRHTPYQAHSPYCPNHNPHHTPLSPHLTPSPVSHSANVGLM